MWPRPDSKSRRPPSTHAELNTPDPEKAKAFYSKLFQWTLDDVANPATPDGNYTTVKVGDGTSRRFGMYTAMARFGRTTILVLLLHLLPLAWAETIPVRHEEGLVHGFLVLRTLDGQALAQGDLIQVARGSRVTCRLVFHFKDGSLHDETAVFSQRKRFRLLSNRLIQKGPAFEHPIDMSINSSSGEIKIRTAESEKAGQVTERMSLPPDVSNGLMLTLLKNIRSEEGPKVVSMVAPTRNPRLVKLKITSQGEDPLLIASAGRKATHYVVKIELGGLTGLIAPIFGKQPPNTHVWILGGEAPAFVKSEGPLYYGGPIWRIELVSPVWPAATKEEAGN